MPNTEMGNMGGTQNSELLCLDGDGGRMWPGLWRPHPAHTLALPSLWVNHHPLLFLRAGMQVPMNIAFETNKSVLPYLPFLALSIFVSRFSILEIWGFCLLFLWNTSKCLAQVFNKTKTSNSSIPAPEFWTSPIRVLLIDHYAVFLQRCLTFWINVNSLAWPWSHPWHYCTPISWHHSSTSFTNYLSFIINFVCAFSSLPTQLPVLMSYSSFMAKIKDHLQDTFIINLQLQTSCSLHLAVGPLSCASMPWCLCTHHNTQ